MDLMEIIRNRRSIRKYRSDEIPQPDLNEVLKPYNWHLRLTISNHGNLF